MRYFISQPMNGKTDEEILNERLHIESIYSDAEPIDSFVKNAPHNENPLWYLGESIKKMSNADFIVFCPGWEDARGCRIEHECAVLYNKHIVYEYAEDNHHE